MLDPEAFKALLDRIASNEPDLVTVNLNSMMLDDQDIQALVEALRENTTVTALNLQDNRLTNIGAEHIAQLLGTNLNSIEGVLPGNPYYE